MATTSNFKFDSINEIFDLSSGMFLTVNNIFNQSVEALFDIYSREPDFWAENQIFKNFSKSLKTCLVGVFWVFQSIF